MDSGVFRLRKSVSIYSYRIPQAVAVKERLMVERKSKIRKVFTRPYRCTELTELNLQVKGDSDMDLDQGSRFLYVSEGF